MQDNGPHIGLDFEDLDVVLAAPEQDADTLDGNRLVKLLETPERRRDDRGAPARCDYRAGKIPDDITNAANLAARQAAVLRRDENDMLPIDLNSPGI